MRVAAVNVAEKEQPSEGSVLESPKGSKTKSDFWPHRLGEMTGDG